MSATLLAPALFAEPLAIPEARLDELAIFHPFPLLCAFICVHVGRLKTIIHHDTLAAVLSQTEHLRCIWTIEGAENRAAPSGFHGEPLTEKRTTLNACGAVGCTARSGRPVGQAHPAHRVIAQFNYQQSSLRSVIWSRCAEISVTHGLPRERRFLGLMLRGHIHIPTSAETDVQAQVRLSEKEVRVALRAMPHSTTLTSTLTPFIHMCLRRPRDAPESGVGSLSCRW